MKKCLPTDIVKHSHWGKFVQSIDALIDKADVWTDVLDQCFKEKESHNDNDNDKEKDGVSVKDETRKGKKRGKGKGKKKLLLPKPKRKTKRNKKLSSNMEFTPLTCMKKHAKEKLKSIEEAFFNEIRDFQHCSQNITNVHSSLAGLDRAIDQCVKVKSGIGSQYIYRSLYVAQLYHCFKSLPREQIMVIPAERLRQQPAQTLEKVLRFVGLSVPSNMSTSDVSDDGIRSAGKFRGGTYRGCYSILSLCCLMWSGATGSSRLLLPYLITSLSSPMACQYTNIYPLLNIISIVMLICFKTYSEQTLSHFREEYRMASDRRI